MSNDDTVNSKRRSLEFLLNAEEGAKHLDAQTRKNAKLIGDALKSRAESFADRVTEDVDKSSSKTK